MKLIIIDTDNVAHRGWHIIKRPNAAIYHVLQGLRFLEEVLDFGGFAFCFDSRTSRRKEFYPDYKANRTPEGKEDLYRQLHELQHKVLPGIGFKNVFGQEGYEADDIIAAICKGMPKAHEVVIVSTDTDLWQLLTDKVTIWNIATKCTFTRKMFMEQYGFEPKRWVEAKAVMGDTADNIKGVQGIGEVNAVRHILDLFGPGSPARARIAASKDLIRRNMKLMTLPWEGTISPTIVKDEITAEKWDSVTKEFNIAPQFRPAC